MRVRRTILLCTSMLTGCGSLLDLGDEPQDQREDSDVADSSVESDAADAPDADVNDADGSESDVTARACPSPLADLVVAGSRAARIAAQSNLVRSCIYAATHFSSTKFATSTVGSYVPCSLDPSASATPDRRYDAAIALLRTVTDFPVPCTSHPPIHVTDETYEMASWLATDHGADPKAIPVAAGMLAHLAMDDGGYQHGGDTSDHTAYVSCAPPGVTEASWSKEASLPFIVASCIEQTLTDSASAKAFECTGLTCGPNAMALAQHVGATPECVCVEDPKIFGPPLATFYDRDSGTTTIARLGEDSSFTVLESEIRAQKRTLAAVAWDLRIFVDLPSGITELVRLDETGFAGVELPAGGFSPGWAGVIGLPNERNFVYRTIGKGGSNKVNPTGLTPTSVEFPIRTNVRLVAASSYDTVVMVDTTGSADVGRVSVFDGSYTKLKTWTGLYPGWSQLVSAGDGYVLFHGNDSGDVIVGRVQPDGSYIEVSQSLGAYKGWDQIATTFDGRFVFYAKGKMAVYRMRADGSLALVREQSGLPAATDLVINR